MSDPLPIHFFFRSTVEDSEERDIAISVNVEEKRRERDDL
jgi:hypothetical protein